MITTNKLFSLKTLLTKVERLKFTDESNLNNFFDDGLENNLLHEISGEGGSGKSNFCSMIMLQAAMSVKNGGLNLNVLYINTVKKFSDTRLAQMIKNLDLSKKDLSRIYEKLFIKNVEASEFETFMLEIEKFIEEKKIKLIIIDSITALSDVQFINQNNEIDFIARAQFLRRNIILFKELIVKFNLFFFVVNNVKGDIERGNGRSVPALGLIWENAVNTRIILFKEQKRRIEIVFSNYLENKKAEFVITDSGLEILNN